MKPIFFISDLHLRNNRPDTFDFFKQFIDEIFLPQSQTLYILGDYFEFWIGDDGAQALGYQEEISLLRTLSEQGIDIYFMHGNRDFLVGEQLCEKVGMKLLHDPTYLTINGQRCLLKHGDDLCTDDVDHQKFRTMTRSPHWQQGILSKSIPERLQIAAQLRETSGSQYKTAKIMDVNQTAIEQAIVESEVDILIHGHTHRPGKHEFKIKNKLKQRIVLGDWERGISYIKVDEQGFELIHK